MCMSFIFCIHVLKLYMFQYITGKLYENVSIPNIDYKVVKKTYVKD